MPTLLIEYKAHRKRLRFSKGLTIGFDRQRGVVVGASGDWPWLAQIEPAAGGFVLADKSRDGPLLVNGVPVEAGRKLVARDCIALDVARITVLEELMPSAEHVPPRDRRCSKEISTQRIEFACSCGVTLRAERRLAGRRAKCGRCGSKVAIPEPGGMPTEDHERTTNAAELPNRSPTTDRSLLIELICSICQCPVEADEQTACPQCRQPYHAECWQENQGCAIYGCSQVNALRTGPDIRISVTPQEQPIYAELVLGRPLPPNGIGLRDAEAADNPTADVSWGYLWLGVGALFLLMLLTALILRG